MTAHGQLVNRDRWVSQARTAVDRWKWANGAQLARFKRTPFCPEKYHELSTMTKIDEGDIVVVPSVDNAGGKSGFAMVTAVKARSASWQKGCYWYDKGQPKHQYRHVLSVRVLDPKGAFFSNARHESISNNLSHRAKPVQRIRNENLINSLSALRPFLRPVKLNSLGKFKLENEKQNREKIERQIAARQGQGAFREKLLIVYGKQCAISACDAVEALDAAHIVPHSISALDDERNGILLRADLHTLFDRRLLAINPNTRKVELHPRVRDAYGEFEGSSLRNATPSSSRPNVRALRHHYRQFQLFLK